MLTLEALKLERASLLAQVNSLDMLIAAREGTSGPPAIIAAKAAELRAKGRTSKPAKSNGGELEDLIEKALSKAEGKQLAMDALKEAVKTLRGKDARSPKDDALTRAKTKLGEKVLVKNGVWKLR